MPGSLPGFLRWFCVLALGVGELEKQRSFPGILSLLRLELGFEQEEFYSTMLWKGKFFSIPREISS